MYIEGQSVWARRAVAIPAARAEIAVAELQNPLMKMPVSGSSQGSIVGSTGNLEGQS